MTAEADLPKYTFLPNSTNISCVAKDGKDLLVQFRNGGTYRYPDEADHHDRILAAPSAGSYLHGIGIKHKGVKA